MVRIENGRPDAPCTSDQSNNLDHADTRTSDLNAEAVNNRTLSPAPSWESYAEDGEYIGERTLVMSTPTNPAPLEVYCPVENEFGSNFKILPLNDQIRELQTILRDK